MDNVKHALTAMYSSTALQDQKKEASTFLESFQKSPQAWDVAHQILANPSEPLEFRMFASQTLRSKATYDLVQLPEQSIADLRISILQLLSVYAAKDKSIRTQLSLALCQLALQDLSWDNVLGDVSSKLSTSADLLPALLEFLKILPEELADSNRTPLTDEEFNTRTFNLITVNVPQVLQLLQNVIGSASTAESLNSAVLDCLNSWIKECPIVDVLRVDSLAELIFKSLTSDSTFDSACECICSVLRETRDVDDHQLIDALYQQLLKVHEFYAGHPHKLQDPEIFSGLTKIYSEAGESWHVIIAKNPEHFKPLVHIILQCSKYDEDLDVVKYTFYFWYKLKQMLSLPKFEQSKAQLLPYYMELVLVIIKHLQYPTDASDLDLFDGDKEQEDKFKEFRYEMGDVLKDCCVVVGAQKALNIPFEQIQTLLSQQHPQWQLIEAPLFSMRVMAKEVSKKEKVVLRAIMQLLVQLPEHPKIRYATTLVLGRYTEWTAQNPDFLEPQLNYIIKGFENTQSTESDILSATSQALMYFCQDCAPLLVQYMEQLYHIYQQMQSLLDTKATYDLVEGLSHVIKELPTSEQYSASETVLKTTLEKISTLCSGSNSDDSVITSLHEESEILSIFLLISRCVDFSAAEFPAANFFIAQIWPLVKQVVEKFGKNLKVSEHFVKILKNAIRSFSAYLVPILEDICEFLHNGFKSTYYGCYLWVTGLVIQNSEEMSDKITVIYQLALSQTSAFLQLLTQDSSVDLRGIPDVIEDYFRMSSDLLMFFPEEVTSDGELTKSIFESGIMSLQISEEMPPLMSCVHFFVDYLSWASEYPPVSFFEGDHTQIRANVIQFALAEEHVTKLMGVVIHGLIFKFYNDVDANDLMIKILTVGQNPEASVMRLKQCVESLANVSEQEVAKLINSIAVALPNKDNRRVRIAIRDFVSWYTRKNVNSRAFA